MSAFMVSDAHIDVLIDVAKQFARLGRCDLRWNFGTTDRIGILIEGGNETEVGKMLLAENARSVAYRYREAEEPAALTYQYRFTGKIDYSPGEAMKALGCYEYQACEHPDWEQSEARAFCRALQDAIISVAIPYPDSAPWGYEEEHLNRTAVMRLF